MLRERTVEALPAWLASARSSAIPEFVQLAHGMQRDLAAIEAAFCRPESNGQTEGNKVNKLKTIKRQFTEVYLFRSLLLDERSSDAFSLRLSMTNVAAKG